MNFSENEISYTLIFRHYVVGGSENGDVSRDRFSRKRTVKIGRVFQTIYFDLRKYKLLLLKNLHKKLYKHQMTVQEGGAFF